MFLVRLIMALLGAGWIAAFNHYRYFEGALPGGDPFWLSTAGGLLFVGILVALGAAVGRWWAPALALALLLSEVVLALADVTAPDGVPSPLTHAGTVVGGTLFFGFLIAGGVGARKVLGRIWRYRPDSTLYFSPS